MIQDLLAGLPVPLVMGVVTLALAVEAGLMIGLILPGTSILLTIGFLAQREYLPLPAAIAAGVAGGVLGAQLGYWLGRRGKGLSVAAKWTNRVAPKIWTRANALVADRGFWAVVSGQWLVSARTITPRVAGWVELPYRTFAMASLPSAAAWGTFWSLVGFFVGQQVQRLINNAVGVVGVIVIVAMLLAFQLRRGYKARAARSAEGGEISRPPMSSIAE